MNRSVPVPEATLIGSEEDSPPRSVVEELRAEMHEASFGAASERHPASKPVGDGCVEMSFVLLESKGDRSQYIGLYRCTTEGAGVGISAHDLQVQVIGEIRLENGIYSKKIVSAQASN